VGSIVLLPGHLQGMGREAACEVLARKAADFSSAKSAFPEPDYKDCSVIGAPADLPDGEYRVTFEGHFFLANRQRGLWLSQGSASRSTPRPPPTPKAE
jgi:hypothetical protein